MPAPAAATADVLPSPEPACAATLPLSAAVCGWCAGPAPLLQDSLQRLCTPHPQRGKCCAVLRRAVLCHIVLCCSMLFCSNRPMLCCTWMVDGLQGLTTWRHALPLPGLCRPFPTAGPALAPRCARCPRACMIWMWCSWHSWSGSCCWASRLPSAAAAIPSSHHCAAATAARALLLASTAAMMQAIQRWHTLEAC